MNLLKYTQYVYLVVGIFFAYDGITKLKTETNAAYLSFFLGAMAIAMFFFRRKFAKKFENQNNNK
ncbi:hypothetical protein [Flavobacterium sp.]|uniref:hypothetical protein n=1 Tax=Flavobacterium sp. TaxID=239 RepID=UPI00286E61F7|nr:hypothetical protein [Flavobacterium sp.]